MVFTFEIFQTGKRPVFEGASKIKSFFRSLTSPPPLQKKSLSSLWLRKIPNCAFMASSNQKLIFL